MNKRSHFKLGCYLLRSVGETKRDIGTLAFLLGTMSPDFFFRCYVYPHFPRTQFRRFDRMLYRQLTLAQKGTWGSLRAQIQLGRICHYLGDFFCFPHNDHYRDNLAMHHHYEHLLWKMLRDQEIPQIFPLTRPVASVDEVIGGIHLMHEGYCLLGSDPLRDVNYISQAFLFLTTSARLLQTAPQEQQERSLRAA